MKENKFAFFGTPEFSTFVLDEMISSGLVPSLVVTTPDKPAGRGLEITQSPVKEFAIRNNIAVLQPSKFDTDFITKIKEYNLDTFVVAAYGKIIPESILSLTNHPPLNVHPSLLPRYRGTSPVESQILSDEKDIGVSIIQMDKEMDHGPIIAQEKIEISNWPISRNDLNNILWRKGGQLISNIFSKFIEGKIEKKDQNHDNATFTKKISKEDGLIDITKSGKENYLKYLAYEGWPGTYFFKNNKRIKITKAKYENDSFIIERVIPEGKKEISYPDFLNSNI
jgi:methionyl-tRNA formyltransferase